MDGYKSIQEFLETIPGIEDPEKEMELIAEEAIEEIVDAFEEKIDAAVTDLLSELGAEGRRAIPAPFGWECPRCHRCYAPCNRACLACAPEPPWPDYTRLHSWTGTSPHGTIGSVWYDNS